MKVFVTGATGMIGAAVVRECVRQNLRVSALCRPSSFIPTFPEFKNAQLVKGDLSHLESVPKDIETVIHCAAKVGDWGPASDYFSVNVEGLSRLLQFISTRTHAQRFVHISSMGVYPLRDHLGTPESFISNFSGFDGYTASKIAAERLVDDFSQKMATLSIRPGFVYGPWDRSVIPNLVSALLSQRFAYIQGGANTLNNTYVDNLAQLVVDGAVRKTFPQGKFNITDDPRVSRKVFVEKLSKFLGIDPPTRSIPKWIAKPLAYGLHRGARALGLRNPPILTLARYKFLGPTLDYSIAKAKRELQYTPRFSYEDGLFETVSWIKQSGMLAHSSQKPEGEPNAP
jgi:2-alkyl-3-oxoalkanoate reductase